MAARSRRPADLDIQARTPTFDLQSLLAKHRYWHGDDPVVTHFFNAMQATFPQGERFFIDSARDAREQIGDANLSAQEQEDIKRFIRQEAIHGKAHDDWNEALIGMGYPEMKRFDEQIEKERTWARKNISARWRISMTAAAEHMTASFARMILEKRPDLVDNAASPIRELLLWHALEEVEHKAVCFDLAEKIDDGYRLRATSMVLTFIDFMKHIYERQVYLLKQDGLWTVRNRIRLLSVVWGPGGIVMSLAPYLLEYFKPDFHPWDTDERPAFRHRYGMDVQGVATAVPA
ncbi:MAG: metal-dependent hydrolase [Pseudomonadota bacterium]